MPNQKIRCIVCGNEIQQNKSKRFRGKIYCGKCYNYNVIECEGCESKILAENMYSIDNERFCKRCYNKEQKRLYDDIIDDTIKTESLKLNKIQKEILKFLMSKGTLQTSEQIIDNSKFGKEAINNNLYRLKKMGIVEKLPDLYEKDQEWWQLDDLMTKSDWDKIKKVIR